MRHIEVSLMEDGELSIDGQSRPAGNIEIREFKDGDGQVVLMLPMIIL